MQFLSTRAVIVNGGDTCPEPPRNNLKRAKKILKARKEKERTQSDLKGSFFIANTGKTTPCVVGRTLKISVEIPVWRKKKDNSVYLGDD